MHRHRNKQIEITFTAFALMLFLIAGTGISGCSDSGKPPEVQAPASIKPKQQVITLGTSTVVEQKPEVVYSYKTAGKRDPFAPLIVKEEQKALTGERPPLERYNIYEFKLSGIVWGGFGYNAMLEGPDGKGYFVHTGMIVGQNKGIVKKITQHTMVVEEKFKTISGEPDRKEIVIELRKKQEGMQ